MQSACNSIAGASITYDCPREALHSNDDREEQKFKRVSRSAERAGSLPDAGQAQRVIQAVAGYVQELLPAGEAPLRSRAQKALAVKAGTDITHLVIYQAAGLVDDVQCINSRHQASLICSLCSVQIAGFVPAAP